MKSTALAFLLLSKTLTAYGTELGGELAFVQGGTRSWTLSGSFEADPKTDIGSAISWTTYPGEERSSSFHIWGLFKISKNGKLRVKAGSTKTLELSRTLDLGVRGSWSLGSRWNLSMGLERGFSADASTLTFSAGTSFAPNDDWRFGVDLSSTTVGSTVSTAYNTTGKEKRLKSRLIDSTRSDRTDFGLWASREIDSLTILGTSLFFSNSAQPIVESLTEIGMSVECEISASWLAGAGLTHSSSSLSDLSEWTLAIHGTYLFPSAKNSSSK